MLHGMLTHCDGIERLRVMAYLCVPAIMIELWTRQREIGEEDENDMEDTSSYEKSGVQLAQLCLEDPVLVMLPAGSGLVTALLVMVNSLAHEIL